MTTAPTDAAWPASGRWQQGRWGRYHHWFTLFLHVGLTLFFILYIRNLSQRKNPHWGSGLCSYLAELASLSWTVQTPLVCQKKNWVNQLSCNKLFRSLAEQQGAHCWSIHMILKISSSRICGPVSVCSGSHCSLDTNRNPQRFGWGVDMNSLMDQRLTHNRCRCQSKGKISSPRHLHQSTIDFGDTAPCYTTTHNQVSLLVVVLESGGSVEDDSQSSSFFVFVFVRVILEGLLTDVL